MLISVIMILLSATRRNWAWRFSWGGQDLWIRVSVIPFGKSMMDSLLWLCKLLTKLLILHISSAASVTVNGEVLRFNKAVIATGGYPSIIPMPGLEELNALNM